MTKFIRPGCFASGYNLATTDDYNRALLVTFPWIQVTFELFFCRDIHAHLHFVVISA